MLAEPRSLRVLALALTLLSGAVMVLAGYIGHTESWTTAGFITVPGGVVISGAFAVARRADRAGAQTAVASRRRRVRRAGAIAATLLSGAVMVLTGYAASARGLGLATLLAAAGGLIVGAAFVLDRQDREAEPR